MFMPLFWVQTASNEPVGERQLEGIPDDEVDPVLEPDQGGQHPARLDIRVGQVDDGDRHPNSRASVRAGPPRPPPTSSTVDPRRQSTERRQTPGEAETAAVELVERREVFDGERAEIQPRRHRTRRGSLRSAPSAPSDRGRRRVRHAARSHDVPATADVDGSRFDRCHPRRGGWSATGQACAAVGRSRSEPERLATDGGVAGAAARRVTVGTGRSGRSASGPRSSRACRSSGVSRVVEPDGPADRVDLLGPRRSIGRRPLGASAGRAR